jgi:hypothetical protein
LRCRRRRDHHRIDCRLYASASPDFDPGADRIDHLSVARGALPQRPSALVQPVLIEIESPGKRWLAGKGKAARPSADFTQALNQLRQWEEWLSKPANHDVLMERPGQGP